MINAQDEEAEAVAEVFLAMEKDIDATISHWERELQRAGWTGSFGMSCRGYIRDELFERFVEECPEIGKRAAVVLEGRP